MAQVVTLEQFDDAIRKALNERIAAATKEAVEKAKDEIDAKITAITAEVAVAVQRYFDVRGDKAVIQIEVFPGMGR